MCRAASPAAAARRAPARRPRRSPARRAPRTAARTAPMSAAPTRRGSAASPPCRDAGAGNAMRRAPRRRRQESRRPARPGRETAPRVRASAALPAAGRARSRPAGPAFSSFCAHPAYASAAPMLPASATSSRYVARLPGCSRLVAGTSSRLRSRRGANAIRPLATSGSCWTMAPTASVDSPTASRSPTFTPSRCARRTSGHASPEGGMPVATTPSTRPGSRAG